MALLKTLNGNWVDIESVKRWSEDWVDIWPTDGKDLNKILDPYLAIGTVNYGESWMYPSSYSEGQLNDYGNTRFLIYLNLNLRGHGNWSGSNIKIIRPEPRNHLDLLGATKAYAVISNTKTNIIGNGSGFYNVIAFYFGSDGFIHRGMNVLGNNGLRDGKMEWVFNESPTEECDPSLIYGGLMFSIGGTANQGTTYLSMAAECIITEIRFMNK